MAIEGGCMCGAVRFRATGEPITTRVCWCRDCQYLGAGGPTTNVCFRTETFVIEGEVAEYIVTAASGSTVHRRFCAKCGTPLFTEAEQRPHLIFARAGTLDDPEIARPDTNIWTARAPSWACIDPNIPANEGQPPPAA